MMSLNYQYCNSQCANSYLSICIPTRNRANILRTTLHSLIDKIRAYNIEIFISDNSTDGETEKVFLELKDTYSFLRYSKTDGDLIADRNFERALHLPETKYRWLFGDHYYINSSYDIENILSRLVDNYDLVVLNANSRVFGVAEGVYADKAIVFKNLGWHMTMMTSLIYSHDFLRSLDFKRFYGTFLSQFLTIFEKLAFSSFRLYWIESQVLGSFHIDPRSTWHSRAFQVFVFDWFLGVMSLPSAYSVSEKRYVINSHSKNVSLFSLKGLFYLRGCGAINFVDLFDHRYELPFVFSFRQIFNILFILLIPKFMAAAVNNIYFSVKRMRLSPGVQV